MTNGPIAPSSWNNEVALGLMNLHDAFLNASLMRHYMLKEPIEGDVDRPELFTVTNRGRCERLWVAHLAVLVEAWYSAKMRPVVCYIESVVDARALLAVLKLGQKSGRLERMKQCRHYSFHRDRRAYWDDGRLAPIGELEFNNRLHTAFSGVLLAAMRSRPQKQGGAVSGHR